MSKRDVTATPDLTEDGESKRGGDGGGMREVKTDDKKRGRDRKV